ncbi:MAG: cyclic nucleotide-binding/CBS domain-containing protein [Candidatus Woesearchaeota archaeon]
MLIEHLMKKQVVTALSTTSIMDVVQLMKKHHTNTVVIVNEHQHVIGMFSERDLVNNVLTEAVSLQQPVQAYMSTHVVTCAPTDHYLRVFALYTQHKVTKIPVVDNKVLVGFITERDLLLYISDQVLDGA